MDFTEVRKSSKTIFEGKIVKVRVDTVELPNGKESTRECIEHPGAVAVIAQDNQNRICLVRQYRYPVSQQLLEIPAGKLSPGEDPLECARRELLEETGIVAKSWEKLYCYYSTPGFTDEIMHLYLATDLTRGASQPDEDEFLEARMIFTRRLLKMSRVKSRTAKP